MTYYLKYRPKTIDELDLARVREQLARSVEQRRFPHAYLFFGPKGTGKTSAARIMAREAGVDKTDVVEMDAASHTGVDDIRDLRERVGLAPSSGDKKAYIVDEVHMLSRGAFNALLKTLEEPPQHVIFFLCTTETEKVPETVVSRCVRVSFAKATVEEIIRSLRRTVKGEKLAVSDEVLQLVASSVDGSFREAQTLLEESAEDGRVSVAGVERALGGAFSPHVGTYVEAILAGNAPEALVCVDAVVRSGGDINLFSKRVLEELRVRLLHSGDERVLTVTRLVEERVRTLRYAPLPQLSLEIVALELGLEQSGGSKRRQVKTSAGQNISGEKSRHRSDSSDASSSGDIPSDDRPDSISAVPRPNTTALTAPEQPNGQISLEDVIRSWPSILKEVKRRNHGVVTLLSLCQPIAVERNSLVLEVRYQFHKEQLEHDRFRSIIESVIRDTAGGNVSIHFRLGEKTRRVLKEFRQDDNIRSVEDEQLGSLVEEIFGQ